MKEDTLGDKLSTFVDHSYYLYRVCEVLFFKKIKAFRLHD